MELIVDVYVTMAIFLFSCDVISLPSVEAKESAYTNVIFRLTGVVARCNPVTRHMLWDYGQGTNRGDISDESLSNAFIIHAIEA